MAQTTIAGGFIDADLVSAQTALTSGLVSTDELIISDAGVLKRMDISVLEDYIVTNLGDNNIDVTQSSHGFAVGDVIRMTTTNNTYAKALADTAANAEVIGIVIDVTDTNNFTYATSGEITVAAAVPNSTTAGDIVFLSTSSAGGTQTTEPSVADQISKPIAVITEANNKMILLPYRGEIISGGATSFAPVDATYLALSANGTLTGERVLTAGTGLTLTDAGAGGAATLTIDNDSITFAKMQNVAANSVLIRNANSSGDLAELALATTQILIGNGTGFTAAALSGEATMTNAGVVSIADNIIDEANLKASNSPTNGYFLSAQSGDTGGLTWAAASGTTINNNADNRVITGSGTASTLEGEASLTFDNAALAFDRDHDGNNAINLINDSNTASASTRLTIQTGGASAGDAVALFHAGGDSFIVGVDNSDSNKFKIANTGGNLGTNDRFVIRSNGDIGIGNATPDTDAKLHITQGTAGQWVLKLDNDGGSGGHGILMRWRNHAADNNTAVAFHYEDSSALRFRIYSDGDVQNHDNSYGSTSDRRLKENIVDARPALPELEKLRMREFSWISDGLDTADLCGVVAQEVLEAGGYYGGHFIKENGEGYYSAYYSQLVPMLVKAVQELNAKIDAIGS